MESTKPLDKILKDLPINVSPNERLASVLAGGALVMSGLSRRSLGGTVMALAGGALLFRGATGHCHGYAAVGKTGEQASVGGEGSLSHHIPGHGGILVEKTITIDQPIEELYSFWRDLESLPLVMSHLETVEVVDDKHSNWVAKGPAGTHVSWSAEIIRDDPNHYIAWRSLPGSAVENSGSVRFKAGPAGRGTELRVILEYQPPAGKVGATVAKLFGEEPNQQVEGDLMRFKQLMETGEISTIDGQPRGV